MADENGTVTKYYVEQRLQEHHKNCPVLRQVENFPEINSAQWEAIGELRGKWIEVNANLENFSRGMTDLKNLIGDVKRDQAISEAKADERHNKLMYWIMGSIFAILLTMAGFLFKLFAVSQAIAAG